MVMKKLIMIMMIILVMVLVSVNTNATTKEAKNNLSIVTVHSVYDGYWKIEYGKYFYVYKNLDYPLNTVFIIADVSGDYPVLIEPMEIKNEFQKVRQWK